MKNLKVTFNLLLILIISIAGKSQCLNMNGDFEQYNSPLPSGYNHSTYINQEVPYWSVGYGNPDIYHGSTAPWGMGGIGALIYLQSYNSNKPESIFMDYQFVAGQTYEISYRLWRNTDAHSTATVDISLASGLQPNYPSGSFQTPTSAQLVHALPWTTGLLGTWETHTQTVTANANFDQLFIHPTSIPWDVYARMAIDDVCITKTSELNCDIEPKFITWTSKDNCVYDFVNITPISYGVTTLQTTWDFGDGTTGVGNTGTHQYSSPGTYLVCMENWITDGATCCKQTICEVITVTTACSTDPCDLIQNADFYVSGTDLLNFTVTNLPSFMANDFGYLWDFGDGHQGTGNSTHHLYDNSGTYQVVLTVFYSDQRGNCCSVSIVKEINIEFHEGEGERVFNIDVNSISPQLSDKLEKEGNTREMGMNTEFQKPKPLSSSSPLMSIEISPNPSSGNIEISSNVFANRIIIMNSSGDIMYKKDLNPQIKYNNNLDLNHLKPGIYLLMLQNDELDSSDFERFIVK